MIQLA
ncbi:hypothetical protein S40285_09594 [Stachybotrys chlorohalonatus IBT 40285]